MGSWNRPKTLQKSSSTVVARSTFRNVTEKVKLSELTLTLEIICEEEHISNIKKLLSRTQQWWLSIPGFYGKLGVTLKSAMDDATELSPNTIWKPIDHFISLALKLLLLDTVVIDRDYSNTCGLCLIPIALENTACSVLSHYNFHIKRLIIYGAMYPSIVEVIIGRSTSLKFLAISQMNLTDDLMSSIAKCTELEVLHLMHNYIWIAVSTNALCKGFFSNASEDFVSSRFGSKENIQISFPNLRILDIGPCMNKFVITFYRWLLYYYKINSVCLDWKTGILEEGRSFSTEKIILPLIDKGKSFRLETLYLNAEFLAKALPRKISKITEFMPEINHLCVDCNFRNSYQGKDTQVGQKLKSLAEKLPRRPINKLYINISTEEAHTCSIVQPFMQDFGLNLTSLSLSSEFLGQRLGINTLKNILHLCPNIEQLKLLFLTRYSIKNDFDATSSLHFYNTKLRELWLHEVSPWNTEQELSHETYTRNWLALLNAFLKSCARLEILSVTVCETMSELLNKLESQVKNFHLHVKDGCEWSVDKMQIINLIKRLPNIENLYLEELEGASFWELKNYFQGSDLNIHWGNLAGWPRS